MSASREKKLRQDQAASGVRDPKLVKAEAEAAKQRRSSALYILIAVVFILVGIAAGIAKSGIIQSNAAAVEISGKEHSVAEYNYFYYNAINNVRSSSYSSYFSLDTSTAYDAQELNDTDKMLLGISDEEIVTWEDYFHYAVEQSMISTFSLADAAEAAGFAFTDEMQDEVDATLQSLSTYASSNGYSSRAYLKLIYGSYMNMKTFKELLHTEVLSQYYQTDYAANLTYTDQQLEDYYAADKECFDQADYEYVYISGAAASTTDEEGNTVEATEEEIAAAAEAAAACYADVQTRMANGETLEEIAASYDDSNLISYSHVQNTTTDGSEVAEWAFAEGRVEGDTTAIDATVEGGTPAYYVALFHSAGRPEYNVVNVRHILVQPDSENEDTEAASADAKAKAEDILKQWTEGEATEDSFAALATEYTEDSGSSATGGLYENVYQGQMVSTFNDWCFDASRKAGDTGIVETSYGYHVMYFVSTGDAYWKVQVRDEMSDTDLDEYLSSLVEGVEVTELSGMKYVA